MPTYRKKVFLEYTIMDIKNCTQVTYCSFPCHDLSDDFPMQVRTARVNGAHVILPNPPFFDLDAIRPIITILMWLGEL